MQVKTILNSIFKHKSFVYKEARWSAKSAKREIEIPLFPRSNSKPICSGCHKRRPGYDRLPERRFEYIPLWAIPVFLVYSMRRVNCPDCGIVVEQVPWACGKHQMTYSYRLFLASWAKRLLYVAKDRTEASLNGFFDIISDTTRNGIKYACTDMLPAYLKVLRERVAGALNILDRFHIAKKFGEAIDKVRAEEHRQLKADGYETLKHSRWCLLKRKENLTLKQTVKLRELLKYNLKSVKAYLMREDFNRFWTYTSATWAGKFLKEWCVRAKRSRLEPFKKLSRTLEKHAPLLLNWFECKGLSSGVVEGFNNKAKLTMRKAYGFKEYETIEIALYHQLGNLPEPKSTHKFWCAVQSCASPAGVIPARQLSFQPVAIGAAMEVTKSSKPLM